MTKFFKGFTLSIALLGLFGCVEVENSNLPGIRLLLGTPSWPIQPGTFVNSQGDTARIEQVVSDRGERAYEVTRSSTEYYFVYPRESRDWYIVESLGQEKSAFIFVKVLDANTFVEYNDQDGERCTNYSVSNYVDLIAAMNVRLAQCPEVSTVWRRR